MSGEFPQNLITGGGSKLATPWQNGSLFIEPFSIKNGDYMFLFVLDGVPLSTCNTLVEKLPKKDFTVMRSSCDNPDSNSKSFLPSYGVDCTPRYTNYNTHSTIRDLNKAVKAIKRHYKSAENYAGIESNQLANIKGIPASWIPNDEHRMNPIIQSTSTFEIDDAFEAVLSIAV